MKKLVPKNVQHLDVMDVLLYLLSDVLLIRIGFQFRSMYMISTHAITTKIDIYKYYAKYWVDVIFEGRPCS